MDTTSTRRRLVAGLAATAFGIAAPLTATTLAHGAVHGHAGAHSRDWDGDKMPNRWELAHGLNAHKANAQRDADRDGLKNLAEFRDGTDPQDSDSDDDGVEDGDDDSPDCATAPATPRSDSTDDTDGTDDCEGDQAEACDDATDDSGTDDGSEDGTDGQSGSSSDDDCPATA